MRPSEAMSPKPPPFQFSLEHRYKTWATVADSCQRHIAEGLLSTTSPWAFSCALHPTNRRRNRYSNVLPWDKTRVKLRTLPGGSDYINASTLRLADHTYIATQGPLLQTIHHFWAMCFDQSVQQDVGAIVIFMLAPLQERGVVKCDKYWPSEEDKAFQLGEYLDAENLAYGDLHLEWVSSEEKDLFTITTFNLSSGDTTRKVLHYYYGEWEDSMPPTKMGPLAALVDELNVARQAYPGIVPIVHCSAGVGRTGTLIAYDHFRNVSSLEGDDPVFETAMKLREQRMMMIQTSKQYLFLYDVVESIAGQSKNVNL